MKKLLLGLFLLVPFLAFAEKKTNDDCARFQCFIACGQVYMVPADVPAEEILKMMDEIESNCKS